MKRALEYCENLLRSDSFATKVKLLDVPQFADAVATAENVFQGRSDTVLEYQARCRKGGEIMDVIDDLSEISATDFYRNYIIPNRPCLIRSNAHYFDEARRLWINDQTGSIQRHWFLENLGGSMSVPVTVSENSSSATSNSSTSNRDVQMSISEWIELLRQKQTSPSTPTTDTSKYYLKDWHFLFYLDEFTEIDVVNNKPIYSVPPHFEHDILNSFVSRFIHFDYRFVYWGPRYSGTPRHSDVLNSFSWSYNVSGTKEWTFYVPASVKNVDNDNGTPDADIGDQQSFQIQQNAGECVFVPSTWQHSVINLEETLSINHNWVTAANLDLVWECIQWNLMKTREDHCLEGEEHISPGFEEEVLREGNSINVSTFFLMVLSRSLELLHAVEKDCLSWKDNFDLVRCRDMLEHLVHLEDENLCLQERLNSVLKSEYRGEQAIETARSFLNISDHLMQGQELR
jgi:hypothetical protein